MVGLICKNPDCEKSGRKHRTHGRKSMALIFLDGEKCGKLMGQVVGKL